MFLWKSVLLCIARCVEHPCSKTRVNSCTTIHDSHQIHHHQTEQLREGFLKKKQEIKQKKSSGKPTHGTVTNTKKTETLRNKRATTTTTTTTTTEGIRLIHYASPSI